MGTNIFNKWFWDNLIIISKINQNKPLFLPHTIHKDQFKMTHRPKSRKILKEIMREKSQNLSDLEFDTYFLNTTQKGQTTKEINL